MSKCKSIDNQGTILILDNDTLDASITDLDLNTLNVDSTDEPSTKRFKVDNTQVVINENITCTDTEMTTTVPIDASIGSVGDPSYTFTDPTGSRRTGFYSPAVGTIGFEAYEADIFNFNSDGITFNDGEVATFGNAGTKEKPQVRFDSNTGI